MEQTETKHEKNVFIITKFKLDYILFKLAHKLVEGVLMFFKRWVVTVVI